MKNVTKILDKFVLDPPNLPNMSIMSKYVQHVNFKYFGVLFPTKSFNGKDMCLLQLIFQL